MKNWNDLEFYKKLALMRLYPEEAKKDKDWRMRLEAYRALGFTEEAKKDENKQIAREAYQSLGFTEEAKKNESESIRLKAYRCLGFTEEAKKDESGFIRGEAKIYLNHCPKRKVIIELTQEQLHAIEQQNLSWRMLPSD